MTILNRASLTLDDIKMIEAGANKAGFGQKLSVGMTREQWLELCASWRSERALLRQPDVTDTSIVSTAEPQRVEA